MAKEKRKILAKDLHGMSIYHEDKRSVYAPFYSKNGYVLTDENCKEYRSYVTNYLFALLIFSIVYIVTKNIVPALLLGLLFLIGAIIAFYLRFLKKAAKIAKASGKPNTEKAGTVTKSQVKEIAEYKMPDLNANDVEAAMKIIEGTARNMGIEVVEG